MRIKIIIDDTKLDLECDTIDVKDNRLILLNINNTIISEGALSYSTFPVAMFRIDKLDSWWIDSNESKVLDED